MPGRIVSNKKRAKTHQEQSSERRFIISSTKQSMLEVAMKPRCQVPEIRVGREKYEQKREAANIKNPIDTKMDYWATIAG